MRSQAAAAVFMIRPASFGYNEQTAGSNSFQEDVKTENDVAKAALSEFDNFIKKLDEEQIETIVLEDSPEPRKPDAVFPNNWISFHEDGSIAFYPMMAANRRIERRYDVIPLLRDKGFVINRTLDFTHWEKEGRFLESTGSIVFDYVNRIGYANLSPRTDEFLLREAATHLNVDYELFRAVDRMGKDIYHTNVLLSIGDEFAVICDEAIKNTAQRKKIINRLKTTGHEIIPITYSQLYAFAANILQVVNRRGEKIILLSHTAYRSLNYRQISALEKYSRLLPVDIPTIENHGGGSVRCMIANIRLPKAEQSTH